MAFVRYQSPDEPAFTVFETSRFRVDHAIFLLRLDPLSRNRFREISSRNSGHWKKLSRR